MDTRFHHFTVPHGLPPPYNLVNAPPPCFQRPPAATAPYTPFEAITIPALENRLEHGFAFALPPSLTQPHPFSVHDIPEEDWLRFLHDVRDAALSVSGTQPGSHGAQLEKQASEAVSQIIDHWNQNFWHRRRIDVGLALDTLPSAAHAFGPGYGARPHAGVAHSSPVLHSPLGLIGEVRAARHNLGVERGLLRGGIRDILGRTGGGRDDWIHQRHGAGLDRGRHYEQNLSTLAPTGTGQPEGHWCLVLRPC